MSTLIALFNTGLQTNLHQTLSLAFSEFLEEFFQSAISEFSQRPFRNTLRDPLRATDSEILSETSKRLFPEPSERETLKEFRATDSLSNGETLHWL